MTSITRLLLIPALVLVSFLLASCQSGDGKQSNNTEDPPVTDNRLTEEAEQQEKPKSSDGLTLEADQKEYETSTEELSATLHNNSDKDFTTGKALGIEKKLDGTWYEFPYGGSFEELAMIISPDSTQSFTLKAEMFVHEWTPGDYRFTKAGLAAPFTVTK